MLPFEIIAGLERNCTTFEGMLAGLGEEEYRWRPAPDKWSLLEVVCHLYDEEREDFGARLKFVLAGSAGPLPPSNPVAWVTDRNYSEQDYPEMVSKLLAERAATVAWLRGLDNPDWAISYQHPTHGPLTAEMFLANWLAHDYLHMRQINSLKYHCLIASVAVRFDYAGEW